MHAREFTNIVSRKQTPAQRQDIRNEYALDCPESRPSSNPQVFFRCHQMCMLSQDIPFKPVFGVLTLVSNGITHNQTLLDGFFVVFVEVSEWPSSFKVNPGECLGSIVW